MTVTERRKEILQMLQSTDVPIAAKDLAARFRVSRQVIVQDMAVIRASTPNIVSTNRGYLIQSKLAFTREFKVRHNEGQVEQELNLIVDCGGQVKNVSISHRVYGRVAAEMDIISRQDVKEFLEALKNSKSTMLGSATNGYHYHLVEAASEQRLNLIENRLKEAGLLAPLSQWEQEIGKEESIRK